MTAAVQPYLNVSGLFSTQPTPQPFVSNVLTQPYAAGVAHLPGNAPCIIGQFYCEFFPYGSVAASDIVATYAGLPCQVFVQEIDASAGTDQRCLIIVTCQPALTDVYTGSDFVLTIGGTASFFSHYGCIAGVALFVDPSFDLSTALGTSVGSVLSPQWSQALPALSGDVGDMLISCEGVNNAGTPVLVTTSSPTFHTEPYAIGAGIPIGMAWRLPTGVEVDAVTWSFATTQALAQQTAFGVGFVLPPTAPPCDPDFLDVVLLLHCDGAYQSTTFVDDSQYAHTITAHGLADIAVSSPIWGDGCLNLPSVGTSAQTYITAPITAGGELDILPDAAGDFTIEGFFYLSATNSANLAVFNYGDDNGAGGAGTSGIQLLASTVTGGNFAIIPTIPSWSGLGGATALASLGWHHFAVTRASGVGRLFLDGVQQGGTASNWNGYTTPVTSDATFGWTQGITGGLNSGFLDEIRVTKGLARYTSNFTPPTEPFGGSCGTLNTVPNVVGQTLGAAVATLAASGYPLGTQVSLYSTTVPAGAVISQDPVAGASELEGTPVNLVLSLGPAIYLVPYVIGLTDSDARAAIVSAGLTTGTVTTIPSLFVPAGVVVNQAPSAGTSVALLSPVALIESSGPPPPPPPIPPFDVDATVISQYAQSPTLLALVHNMAGYLDPRADLEAFYSYVWNVDTAVGFGLDIWGKIVNVSRLLNLSGTSDVFGFFNSDLPLDWQPFNQAPFSGGNSATSTYLLPDDAYRTLILKKALANIVATNAPSLNQLLRNLFPGRGVCFVTDNGHMSMTFVFDFPLTTVEFAILTQSGALPHPAGVFFDVNIVGAGDIFGFEEASPTSATFGQGTFHS